MAKELTKEEIEKSVANRLEVIGKQGTLFGESIDLVQFKNLKQKQETKAKVLSKFKGEIFRSIITPKTIDGNKRLDKIERQNQSGNRDSISNTIERADSFGKKTLNTLSTFASVLTMAYTNLLCPEGENIKILDVFAGHNSRCSDVLSMGKKYVGFDIFNYPLEMCEKYAKPFGEENYLLLKQSSEDIPFEDETFDFALTCPPYFCAENYSQIYEENNKEDLSTKDYEEFKRLYKKCFSEAYRTLKAGAYSVVVIGDVHKAGRLYTLGFDTVEICRELGFRLHDINVYNRQSNIGGDLNPTLFLDKLKRFPTVHEWILIFQKPKDAKSHETKDKIEENFNPRFDKYSGTLEIPLKKRNTTLNQETPKHKPSIFDKMVTKPPELAQNKDFPKVVVKDRLEYLSVLQGLVLSFNGIKETELRELGLPVEKIRKVWEVFSSG